MGRLLFYNRPPAEGGPLRALIAPGWRQLLVMFPALYVRGRERVSARPWESQDETHKGLNDEEKKSPNAAAALSVCGVGTFFSSVLWRSEQKVIGSCKSVTVPETLCPLKKLKNAKMCSLSSLALENTLWKGQIPKKTKNKTMLQGLNVESRSKNLVRQLDLHQNNCQKLMTKHSLNVKDSSWLRF